eukprot:3234696-Pyramimonas_sp.AAC.1
MGIDRLSPLDFERLPDEALAELCMLYPAMVVVGRLLAKKPGGDRVIGLIAMLCRVWNIAREPCAREWSASLTSASDAAIAGNSALREAYRR